MGGGDHMGDYPKGVWSPAGGWYADPKHWRRNTAVAVAGMFLVGAWAFRYSARNEQHHNYPTRPILSQLWCKNFPPPPEGRIGGAP